MAKDHKAQLESLIRATYEQGGSDLHISEGRYPAMRIAGALAAVPETEILTHAHIESFLDILLSPASKDKFLHEKEIDFSYSPLGLDVRFRGNAYFQQGLVGISLRLIPKVIKGLQELNLPAILESFASKKQGFFLAVGPVGQGKSTTLACMLEIINRTRSEHIVTIEDPIEYIYTQKKSIIEQREVRVDTADFYTALVNVLRQDVNVIMVGEMRDKETMAAAVTAAETGHLVFSTLHTNNAAQTIDRIIDSFPADQQNQIRTQLSGSLTGIFSQRLIPRIAGGLIPVYELLIVNNAVSNLIREKRTHEISSVIETSSELGMIDMNHTLAELVKLGEITLENAYLHSTNPKLLERML